MDIFTMVVRALMYIGVFLVSYFMSRHREIKFVNLAGIIAFGIASVLGYLTPLVPAFASYMAGYVASDIFFVKKPKKRT